MSSHNLFDQFYINRNLGCFWCFAVSNNAFPGNIVLCLFAPVQLYLWHKFLQMLLRGQRVRAHVVLTHWDNFSVVGIALTMLHQQCERLWQSLLGLIPEAFLEIRKMLESMGGYLIRTLGSPGHCPWLLPLKFLSLFLLYNLRMGYFYYFSVTE